MHFKIIELSEKPFNNANEKATESEFYYLVNGENIDYLNELNEAERTQVIEILPEMLENLYEVKSTKHSQRLKR